MSATVTRTTVNGVAGGNGEAADGKPAAASAQSSSRKVPRSLSLLATTTSPPEGFEFIVELYRDALSRTKTAHDELKRAAPGSNPFALATQLSTSLAEAGQLFADFVPHEDAPDPTSFALLAHLWECGRGVTSQLAWVAMDRAIRAAFNVEDGPVKKIGNGPIFDEKGDGKIKPAGGQSWIDSGLGSAVLSELTTHLARLGTSKLARSRMAFDQGLMWALFQTARDRCLLLKKVRGNYGAWREEELVSAARDVLACFEFLDLLLAEDARYGRLLLKPIKSAKDPLSAVHVLVGEVANFAHQALNRGGELARLAAATKDVLRRVVIRLGNGSADPKRIVGILSDQLDTVRAAMEGIAEHDALARFRGLGLEEQEKFDDAAEKIARAMNANMWRKRAKTWYEATPNGAQQVLERRRVQAVTKIAAVWRGIMQRRAYRAEKAIWKPLMEPSLGDKRIELEVEVPYEEIEKLAPPSREPWTTPKPVIYWKNLEFNFQVRLTDPTRPDDVTFELTTKRTLPQQLQLQVRPICSIMDNTGRQHFRREPGQTLTVTNSNRTVALASYDRSVLDVKRNPNINKKGHLVVRIALSVVKFQEPPAWVTWNAGVAEKQKAAKMLRTKLDKMLTAEAAAKKGPLGNAGAVDAAQKDELYVKIAASELIGKGEDTDRKLEFYAVIDAGLLRQGYVSKNLLGYNKWKAEQSLGFDVLLHPATPDNENGTYLGAFLSITDNGGKKNFDYVPSDWRRDLEFRFTLLTAQPNVYDVKGTAPNFYFEKDISIPAHYEFSLEGLEAGKSEVGKLKAFPISTLDKNNGYIVETENPDKKQELFVLKVEVLRRVAAKAGAPGATKVNVNEIVNEAKNHAKSGAWYQAVLAISKAIEKEPTKTNYLVLRAKYNLEDGCPMPAETDIGTVLSNTSGAHADRLQALLLLAQIKQKQAMGYQGDDKNGELVLDFATEGLDNVDEVLKWDAKNKMAIDLRNSLLALKADGMRSVDEIQKQEDDKRAKQKEEAARQCPDGRNCKKPGCQLIHPAGYTPPPAPAPPPPDAAAIKRMEEEKKDQTYFKMLISWLDAIQLALPEDAQPQPQLDLINALFPPREASREVEPTTPSQAEVVTPVEEGSEENKSRAAQRRIAEDRKAIRASITGDTIVRTVFKGAGRGSLRVYATAHTQRELIKLDLTDKIREMFEGRAQWQHQKIVADKVREGRINKKERIFYVELEPERYLITAIVLNHKGFDRVIEYSMNVLETVKEMGPDALKALTEGVDDDETEDEKRENARLIHHSEIVRDLVFKFRADSAGNTELGDDFFLPRRFLGNLDMLIETDVATGRTSAVLTQQEKNAIEQACVQKVSLFIKGSAGNGKTTVLSEIAKSSKDAVLVLPTTRLQDQVLRSYPEIRAVTVEERLRPLWPADWRRSNFADFSQEARKRHKDASTDQIADMWVSRLTEYTELVNDKPVTRMVVPWYKEWKDDHNYKDEDDLWKHLEGLWAAAAAQLGNADDMDILVKEWTDLLLMDEAQSLTPLQVKLLAISSGHPDRIVVGLDSKQSVGRQSAGRRTDVRQAIKEACDAVNVTKYTHGTVPLTINFRCPVGVLQVLDSVLKDWLKPHFSSDFDDFQVDTVIRSSLWDSPPVILCETPEAARKLLAKAKLPFVVLHTKKQSAKTFDDLHPLLTLGIDDCRGLEFEELCVLDKPLEYCRRKLFTMLAKEETMTTTDMDAVRDAITGWLVLMTRCMFGAVWVENARHPIIQLLRERSKGERKLLLDANTDEEIDAAVVFLRRARDVAGEESGRDSMLKALSKIMATLGEKVETHKEFIGQAVLADQLICRLTDSQEHELGTGVLALPEVLKKIEERMAPPSNDPKATLALKHYAPLVNSYIRRSVLDRGKLEGAAPETRKLAKEAQETTTKIAEKLKALGYSV